MADGNVLEIAARLRSLPLFRGMSDAVLTAAAELFSPVTVQAGTVVFHEGTVGEHFYLVLQGRGEVTVRAPSRGPLGRRRHGPVPQRRVSTLEPGEYFGAGALLTGRRRSATVTALTEMKLLRTGAPGFRRLLQLLPKMKLRLALDERTYRAVRQHHFDWQESDEVILIYAQKHWFVLLRHMLLPVAAGVVGAVVLVLATWFLNLLLWPWLWAVVAGLTLLIGLWAALVYIDWVNDYYVITSKRVLHEERVLLIYQARIEAPLYTLRSVQLKRDTWMRALDFGDVVLQTFAGTIEFPAVPQPQILATVAMEMVAHEQAYAAVSERRAIRDELLRQMGLGAPPPTAPTVPVPVVARRRRRTLMESLRAWGQALRQAFSFQTRSDVGGVITYRKHPWVLLVEARIPLLLLTLLAFTTLARVVGEFTGWLSFLPLNPLVCGLELLVALPLLFWAYYRYADWHNDIYQVTGEAIFDIERKPFLGKEERRQAPLEGVLNVQVTRPSLMANLLNFGDVIVQTGGKTGELTFDHVFDPLTIQQDIWRKFEMLQDKKREAEASRRRAEIAVWFAEFRQVLEDNPPVE